MRQTGSRRATTAEGTSPAEPLIWWSLQAALIGVSLIIAEGHDVYRLPKLLLFEAAAIVLFAGCAIVSILDPQRGILQRLAKHRGPLIIAAAAIGWTAIGTAASTQKRLSAETLLWVASCGAFFLLTVALAERRQVRSVGPALIAPAIVAGVAILQRLGIWNPFRFVAAIPIRVRTTGYIGNPDEVGGYLLVPALAAVALAVANRGTARVAYAAVALLVLVGVMASETLTALLALSVAAAVMIIILSRRAALRMGLAAAAAIALVFILNLSIAERMRNVASELLLGRVDMALSYRTQGFGSAWAMFVDHPLLGVGPGCFAYWYLPYTMLLSGAHPENLLALSQKYQDVHNDHLQLLATTGVPGYAIFLVALFALAARARGGSANARQRFARLLAAPAAAGVVVLTLGQFPLELAALTMMFLYFAALVVAWSDAA